MATKIRLQRHGRRAYPFYKIVVADSRAPRDGRFIEKIGTYNPNTNPATIDLNFERALHWVKTGAEPTTTTRNILSGEGVFLMKHLEGGIKKGALTSEQAQAKFEAWSKKRQEVIGSIKAGLQEQAKAAAKAAFEAEQAANATKAAQVAEKRKAAEAAAKAEEAPAEEEAPATEEA